MTAKTKLLQQLANDIECAIRSARLLPEDLVYGLTSIEIVRAIQEIPWDKYEAVSDDTLEEILFLRGRHQQTCSNGNRQEKQRT